MGWASFTAFIVAAVQEPVDGTLQPIENSPPGIQAMPVGALLGTGVLLGIVAAKSDPSMANSPSAAETAGESQIVLNPNNVSIPNETDCMIRSGLKLPGFWRCVNPQSFPATV